MMPQKESDGLGNASLVLGIAALALVFGIGICSMTGAQQGWIGLAATPLLVCGLSSAFLGFLGAGLGFVGLFGNQSSKKTAVFGLLLSLMGMCLFLFFLSILGAGG